MVKVLNTDGKSTTIESDELKVDDEVIVSQRVKMEKKKTLIEFKNITKVYGVGDAKTYALNGVDFSIKEGEFVAIMGASGSGKSTAMIWLDAWIKATSGEYLFNGINVENFK